MKTTFINTLLQTLILTIRMNVLGFRLLMGDPFGSQGGEDEGYHRRIQEFQKGGGGGASGKIGGPGVYPLVGCRGQRPARGVWGPTSPRERID